MSRRRLAGPVTLAGLIVLAACTRPAPDLPPDDRPAVVDPALQALSCDEIAASQGKIAKAAVGHGAAIKQERGRNQAAGYFSAFFLPTLLLTKHNDADKQALDRLQAEWDALTTVAKAKACPFDPDLVFRGAASGR